MNELENEILSRIETALSDLVIDCPDCEYMEDDQYTCTTCWCEGGNGELRVRKYIKITL